jgi:type IV secretion system protein VirB10
MAGEKNTGVQVERSEKKTNSYSMRIVIFFVLAIGLLLSFIAARADFGRGGVREEASKNYRAPQPSGFAELANEMRRDRRPVQTIVSAEPMKEPERRVIAIGRRAAEPRLPMPSLPRYYSNRDDAQAASQLRMMKIQALTAKPVVEDFRQDGNGGVNGAEQRASSGIPGIQANAGQTGPMIMDSASVAALMQQGQAGQKPDPNGQGGKQNFLRGTGGGGSMTPQGYSDSLPVPQQFPYELKAGTIIPGLLITGINSDLPGNVLGQVSENVWDTATGKFVLIPKGTRILGVYDSEVSFGQRRVLLVWNRLVFPNGTTLDIAGSPGVDQAGYSGLSGRVNEHWGAMLKSALISSVFVAGAEMVYDGDSQGNSENRSPRDVAAESAAGSIIDMGAKLTDRASGIQPTITVRSGKKFGIFVQKDVVFPFPYF